MARVPRTFRSTGALVAATALALAVLPASSSSAQPSPTPYAGVSGPRSLPPGGVVVVPPHADPPPPGVDVSRRPSTRRLLEDLARAQRSAVRGAPEGLVSRAGRSCPGTGTDGNRVQVLYAHEAGGPERYASVLPVLRHEVAGVDEIVSASAARTGGQRRVRWVSDPVTCDPVVAKVELPPGALGDFTATIAALAAKGYDSPRRKYLVFAESDVYCGIATSYSDDSHEGRAHETRTGYSRVDSACWGAFAALHELTHNLGGVQPSAPNATAHGHCSDEWDLMCYPDAPGVRMREVCPDRRPLLDCGSDDYFSTDPPPGSYLAEHWNTANSTFLDHAGTAPGVPPGPSEPPLQVDGPTRTRSGLPVALAASATPAGSDTGSDTGSWFWSADRDCLVGPRDRDAVTLQCPTTVTGPITVRVSARLPEGQWREGRHVVQVGAEDPARLVVGLSSTASSVTPGTEVLLRARAAHAGVSVRAVADLYASAPGSGRWQRVRAALDLGASGTGEVRVRPRRTTAYRLAVRTAAGAGWSPPPSPTRTVRVPVRR